MTTTSNLELARERTVQALCSHFAHDHLSLDEVDRRLEAAQTAASAAQLTGLLADLPAPRPVPGGRTDELVLYFTAGADEAPTEQRVLALLGQTRRTGVWTPPRRQHVRAILGEAILDYREARLRPGVTEVDVLAFMGNVEVIVPPGVAVECVGGAILGQFGEVSMDAGYGVPAADAPTIRLVGNATLGNVEVRVRRPGESGLQALKRRWKRELFGEY